MKLSAPLILVAALFALGFHTLHAQHKPLPPPRDVQSDSSARKGRLPSLSFPEFVITGADVVRFDDNLKETLAGFDPAEFALLSGRRARENRRPEALTASSPLAMPVPRGSEYDLLARAAMGSFTTPSFEARFGRTFPRGDLTAGLELRRSNGHVELAGFERGVFDLSGGSYFSPDAHRLIARSRIQGAFKFDYSSYFCYGDPPAYDEPLPDFRRKDIRISYSGDLISRKNRALDSRLRLFADHATLREYVSFRDSLTLAQVAFAENTFGLSAGCSGEAAGLPVEGGLFAAFGANTATSAHPRSPVFVSLSAISRHSFSDDFTLEGEVSFYLYRGSAAPISGRLYPKLKLQYRIDDEISVFGAWHSRVERVTVGDLLDANPYLAAGPSLRHRDAQAGVIIGLVCDNRSSIHASVTLDHAGYLDYGILRRQPAPASRQWDVFYEGYTEITSLRCESIWAPYPAGRVHAVLAARSSRNDVLDARVPFLPDAEGSLRFAHTFGFPLEVSAEAVFLGSRAADETTLPALLLFHASAEYRFTRNFGIYCEVRNLLDARYSIYPGYVERPFAVFGGIAFRL